MNNEICYLSKKKLIVVFEKLSQVKENKYTVCTRYVQRGQTG